MFEFPRAPCRTLWFTPVANVRMLRMHDLKMIRKMYEQQSRGVATDRALFTLDLDADLTGVWNWNVKQLFVYITADFSTASNVRASEGLVRGWTESTLFAPRCSLATSLSCGTPS